MDICADCYADGLKFDFACGDEVYGDHQPAGVFRGQRAGLRAAGRVQLMITLALGTRVTCAEAVKRLVKDKRRWEVRSAGKGPKGGRWYAWAWIATASPPPHLLVRRHLKTGELAFHYCYVPEGQPLTKTRLIRAAGLRWPVAEDFKLREGQPRPGPVPGPALHRDPASHRAGHRRPGDLRRHRRLAQGPHRCPGPAARDARPGPAVRPGHDPAHRPRDKTPARRSSHPAPSPRARRPWLAWRRRHQARSRWFHQRTRPKPANRRLGTLANGGCRTRPSASPLSKACPGASRPQMRAQISLPACWFVSASMTADLAHNRHGSI